MILLFSYRGTVKENDRLLLGPDESGYFHPVEVHSIHRNRSPCRVVRPGQAATLAVGEWDKIMLRKVSELGRAGGRWDRPVEVHTCSIHRNRSPCRVVRPGQAATLAVGE